MKKNADGGVTLKFGPTASTQLENAWIPTSGKIPFAMFPHYSSQDVCYERFSKPADAALVG